MSQEELSMAWTDALGGSLGGAGTGFMFGGPIGAGIGGLLGLLGGGLAGSGEPEKQIPLQKYTPQQQALMNQLGQQGATGLQGILNSPLDSKALEDEAMRQYQQQIIPGLMSTLTSAPTAGLQRSSAFGQQLGAAGTDLATRLAALRSQVAMQQQGLRANIYGNMLGQGLNQQFEPMYKPQGQSFGQGLLGVAGSMAGPYMQGMGMMNALSGLGGLRDRNKPNININTSPEAQWLNSFDATKMNLTGSGI